MNARILLCEDEKNIVTFLQAELERADYLTDVAGDGEGALRLFTEHTYDLVLLDLMLPRKSGLEVLQAIRAVSAVPVIILTARKDTFDKVLLLKSGADDYMTKPFDTLELLARAERCIARNRANGPIILRDLSIDPDGFICSVGAQALTLTKTEFDILLMLCQNEDKVLSRDTITQRLYGWRALDSNIVDVNIKNIRRKFARLTDVVYIETVRGKGYVIRS